MIDTCILIVTRHCRVGERQKKHDRGTIKGVQEAAEGEGT